MFRNPVWARLEMAAGAMFDALGGEYRCAGQRFHVPRDLTTRAFRGRFLFGIYELPERRLLARHLPPDATVLELGGCLGVVSCLANARLRHRERHLVVEANPALIPWLHRNRDRNGAAFGIEHAVVARGAEERAFWPGGNIVGGSATRQRGEPVMVPTRSVEALEEKHDLRFDTLVMDIEGGEVELLRDNPALLARARLVLVEFHPMFIGEAACEAGRATLRAAGLVRRGQFALAEAWVREA
jgi:FkbM family methyltransferase